MKKWARLAVRAKADLADIWYYIAQDDVSAAVRFNARILDQCQRLAEMPGIGRERSELEVGLRSFPVGNYVIFYRQTDFGVEVVRVLSGFRDIPNVMTERT